jgi:hypothetical protein
VAIVALGKKFDRNVDDLGWLAVWVGGGGGGCGGFVNPKAGSRLMWAQGAHYRQGGPGPRNGPGHLVMTSHYREDTSRGWLE